MHRAFRGPSSERLTRDLDSQILTRDSQTVFLHRSTRVTGAAMHAARAGTAPLLPRGTLLGTADVAKVSSIKTRRVGLRGGGGGEGTARGWLSKKPKSGVYISGSLVCLGGHHAGTGRLRNGDVDAAGAGGVLSLGAGGVHAAVGDGCGRRVAFPRRTG